MNKQIDEMAREFCSICHGRHKCENPGPCAMAEIVTEGLYNAGYRKQEWISVEERLPSTYVSVLVYMPDETPHPTVREGFINKRGEWYAGGFDRHNDEVVAWMKMPEAPKMKGGVE